LGNRIKAKLLYMWALITSAGREESKLYPSFLSGKGAHRYMQNRESAKKKLKGQMRRDDCETRIRMEARKEPEVKNLLLSLAGARRDDVQQRRV